LGCGWVRVCVCVRVRVRVCAHLAYTRGTVTSN